jgi:ATP-dependent Lhr-like helicase
LPGLPPRVASTWLVYHGSRLVMVAKRLGKSLDIFTAPGDPHVSEYFRLFKDLLNREFNPAQKILVETINSEPALISPYAEALRQFGFRSSRSTLELWREV